MKEIPLLLIHGYPFDHSMWFSTIASLGRGARVVAPDLPGFGRNPAPPSHSPSLEVYAAFLAEQLAEGGHQKAVVAGMSMGGYVALAFAEKYPDQVAGLGLISSQAAADSPEIKAGRQESINKIKSNGLSVVNQTLVPKMFSERANGQLRDYAFQGAARAGVGGLSWALAAMAQRPDRTALLRRLSCPVLVAHGTEDKIIPIARARVLAEVCQKPIFLEIPGAGHATPLENPDKIAEVLARLMTISRQDAAAREAAPLE